jgi:hypothetical protein
MVQGQEEAGIPDKNLYIAYGVRMSPVTISDGSFACVHYEITKAIKGKFRQSIIEIVCREETVRNYVLPDKAILLLEHDARYELVDLFYAIGSRGDKGILPDTEVNRKAVESLQLRDFLNTPIDKRIDKAKAISIAEQEIRRRGDIYANWSMESSARRYGYGWKLWITPIDPDKPMTMTVSNWLMIDIEDSGEIVSYHTGM